MRVNSPLGAVLLRQLAVLLRQLAVLLRQLVLRRQLMVFLQLIVSFGCGAPGQSRGKDNASTTDGLAATRGESTSTGDSASEVGSNHFDDKSQSDAGVSPTAQVVTDDGGLNVLRSDTGQDERNTGAEWSSIDGYDAAKSDAARGDAAGLTPEHDIGVDGGSTSTEHITQTSDAGASDGGNAEAECATTQGRCDPTGACAEQTCQFETSGKSCAFTPTRDVPFSCVFAGDAPDYSPCDLDDACKPGSVCVADTFVGRDMNDNPVPRRSGSMCRATCNGDEDCADGDWCQQATDDNNEPLANLRVCHRFCQDPSQCYGEPVNADIRCTPRDTQLGLEVSECSRKPNNLAVPSPPDTSSEVQSGESGASALSSDSTTPIKLISQGLLLQAAQLEQMSETDVYCLSNWDCEAANALCVDNTCRVGCEQTVDCAEGTECLVVDGIGMCSQPCVFDAEAGNSCSVNPNCGCSDGQTCRVNDDQTTSCSSVGEQGYMVWCATQDHCGEGLSCIAGLCRPICVPGQSECIAGHGECVLTIKSETVETFTCSGDCDPVNPHAADDGRVPCGKGAVCLPSWATETYPHALCVSENPTHAPATSGELCAEDFDCESGLGCDAAGTCQRWCRNNDDCDADQQCNLVGSVYGAVPRYGLNADDVIGLCD